MKILIVTGPYVNTCEPFIGGTEAFVVTLANELVRRGHSVDVLTQSTDEHNLFQLLEYKPSPLNMENTRYDNLKGQERYITSTFGLMDLRIYDVIHYNSFSSEIYAAGALHYIPSVLTMHLNVDSKLAVLYKLFCERTAAIPVAISERMRDSWQQSLGIPTPIIHNGVDIAKWPVHDCADDGYLLWSGRISPDKNPEAAIQIANRLQRPLKIVGMIFDQMYFDGHIKPLLNKRIQYVGHQSQEELSRLAAGASIYLATAQWQEPFGLATVEMLASGLPVVGFTSAIPPELRCADVSIAVESTDWQDLLAPLQRAQSVSPAQCREFATRFTIGRMAEAYEAVYKQSIERMQV